MCVVLFRFILFGSVSYCFVPGIAIFCKLACTPAEILPISVRMPVEVTTAHAWPPVIIVPEKTMLRLACGCSVWTVQTK